MTLSITLCLQLAVLTTGGETYAEAFKATSEKGCPLVVMVGATWCPACQTMKNSVIPEVRRQGHLRKVAFAEVDLDQEQELGKKLTGGGPLPQLLIFWKTEQGWKSRRLIGGRDAQAVEKFIVQRSEDDSKPQSTGGRSRDEKLGEARTASVRGRKKGVTAN
jgi:thiol-disulfide isomerase/thioredoxin